MIMLITMIITMIIIMIMMIYIIPQMYQPTNFTEKVFYYFNNFSHGLIERHSIINISRKIIYKLMPNN